MSKTEASIRHLVFDLGGVLVDFRGVASLATRLRIAPALMAEQWLKSESVRAYERGATDTETFINSVIAEFGQGLTDQELREQMRGWLPGPLPGALDLLRDLAAAGISHSCLSNTNTFHWREMQSWHLDRTFAHSFLSHELRMVKPDPEIFEHVSQTLELPPSSIAFFDDHPTNVAAARAFGLTAIQTTSPHACRSWLGANALL